ncbi:MAG: YhbY family RNA-binding protein [Pseudomonadales bacterium]
MSITSAYRKQLKAIGHNLHAIITVADKGVTETIHAEIERALDDHELIKIRLSIADRQAKRATGEDICLQHKAALIQRIGNIILIFRAAEKPNPKLSNLLKL